MRNIFLCGIYFSSATIRIVFHTTNLKSYSGGTILLSCTNLAPALLLKHLPPQPRYPYYFGPFQTLLPHPSPQSLSCWVICTFRKSCALKETNSIIFCLTLFVIRKICIKCFFLPYSTSHNLTLRTFGPKDVWGKNEKYCTKNRDLHNRIRFIFTY